MKVVIFDVEHGACSLITCENNNRLMIDCGHNATSGWKPGTYLRSKGIYSLQMLGITNYDEDHVSGIANLEDSVSVERLWRNNSVTASTLKNLKTEDGMGPGIDRLVNDISYVYTAPATIPFFPGVEIRSFWNPYPEFNDENNLSMVAFVKCHGIGVLFPGDLENEGWLKLLEQESFRQALRETSVLMASHHGRENGCCEQIKRYCKPFYVLISDKGYMYDTQKTIPFYYSMAKGGPFRDTTRYVLTTRCDGKITFTFTEQGWSVE